MASNTVNMSTWEAKRIIGDTASSSWSGALLHSGTGGKPSSGATSDTWIFADDYGTAAAPWGIKHDQDNNNILFIGAGTTNVTVHLGESKVTATTFAGNASTATIWQTARTLTVGATGKSVNGSANVSWSMNEIMGSSDSSKFYRGDKTWSNDLVGSLNLQGNLTFSNSGTAFRGINYGTMGDNDQWRVGGAATASNAGYMEIATADDGTEPIYVRQYTGVFSTLKRTLTLLDGSGNTVLPGEISIGTRGVTSGPSSITYSNRITIVPYFHTGGPWYIKSGDDASNAYLALYYGSSNLIKTKHNGNIEITSPATDSVGVIHVVDTRTDANWHYPFLGTCASLAANGNMYICIGKSASTGNAAGLRYQWAGASSNSNLMGFEFYGQGTKLWAYANGNGGVSAQWSCNWLRVINNSSNNSDDATVYIECKTANDWGLKINKGGTAYGIYVDALDKDPAIQTNGYIRGRCIWANQGSNGERQVGVDSKTSGTLYLWSNTTDKGLYSSSGYSTGYVIQINGSGKHFYGTDMSLTGNLTVNSSNTTGGGIILSDDGDIVDLNDAYCSMRFTYGVRIFSANKGGSATITLASGGNITASALYPSGSPGSNCYFGAGNGDGNGSGTANIVIRSWYGVGFMNGCTAAGTNGAVTAGVDCRSGHIYANAVHNAVWNDYAECRKADIIEGGYCVTETPDGSMMKTTERLQPGCKLTSDTYGSIMGETDEAKTPIAVAGRVLVYPYHNRNNYPLGAAVCSAPNGTIDIMTRDEIIMYPERIVGTVSEIPTYTIWRAGGKDTGKDIEVNGRIWVYVK